MKTESKIIKSLLLCTLLSVSLPTFAEKIIQGTVQEGDNFIVAKGDIPTPDQFSADILNYRKNVVEQLEKAELALNQLIIASEKKQLVEAQKAYQQAHYHYEMIRPIISLFGNTERLINNRASFFPEKENDARFSGFHLVEYQLFALKDTQLAAISAQALLRNVTDLKKRVAIEDIPIPKLVQAAGDGLELILSDKLAGVENQYSHSDLADSDANLQGSRLIVERLSQHIPKAEYHALMLQYDKISHALLKYKISEGVFQPLDKLPETEKSWLFSQITQLAEQVATLRGTLNIDVYYHYKEERNEQ